MTQPSRDTVRSIWHALRQPVLPESRELLARNWSALPTALQTPHQMLGKQGNGCGATIGAMPRCDFACRGCYLGEEANKIPAQSVEEIKAQMRALRPVLGPAGNLQITDGEVTLRPVEELVELLRYAREIDLIPMLMTHGDSFHRRPGLLEQLVRDGGLRELSIHVDTTQRGRVGPWRDALTEAALNPLRAEFGAMLRDVRERTGMPVRAATTMTVTPDNLAGVADVVRWLVENPDEFFMVSFQPIAQVGRTQEGLGDSVSVERLWEEIARGVHGDASSESVSRLLVGQKWLGHPACNRFVHGVVAKRHAASGGAGATFHPIRSDDDALDRRSVDGFLARFGGVSFRRDGRLTAISRVLGMVVRDPLFFARSVPPFVLHWLRRVSPQSPLRGAWEFATGTLSTHGMLFVSHHFMSRAQLETPLGQERVKQCVFHVPINGELVSMCEVNALGVRERYYAQITSARRANATPTSEPSDAERPAPVS